MSAGRPADAVGALPHHSSLDAEPLLHDADAAIERLGLKGRKSAYWLKQEARAQRIPCTRAGKTLMWSEQNLLDIVALLSSGPRNKARR